MDLVAERRTHRAHVLRIDQGNDGRGRLHAGHAAGADAEPYRDCGGVAGCVDPRGCAEQGREDQGVQGTLSIQLFAVDFKTVRGGAQGQALPDDASFPVVLGVGDGGQGGADLR